MVTVGNSSPGNKGGAKKETTKEVKETKKGK